MKRATAALAALLLGCSRSTPLSHARLEHEIHELHSLDEEAGLFEETAGPHRMTHAYARGHARYLYRAAQEHTQVLARAPSVPGDSAALQNARANAARLEARFVALMLRIR